MFAGMYNTTELVLEWEEKTPISFDPDMRLTEYNLQHFWYNETVVNSNEVHFRHGAFSKFLCSLGKDYISISLPFVFSWQLQLFEFHGKSESRNWLLSHGLLFAFNDDCSHILGFLLAAGWCFSTPNYVGCVLLIEGWRHWNPNNPFFSISTGTSTMLSFITLSSSQSKTLPKVSYIKVSEVWFLGCTFFIFGSLVEFAFVNTIWRRKENIELKKVNSKYILKSTLTPRPTRREMGLNNQARTRSCSSLDNIVSSTESVMNGNVNQGFNNYLTVHVSSWTTHLFCGSQETWGDLPKLLNCFSCHTKRKDKQNSTCLLFKWILNKVKLK